MPLERSFIVMRTQSLMSAPIDPCNLPWFVLYVKPRHEKNVGTVLRGKGYEEFIPLYPKRTQKRTSDLPLFPGYVFCRFNLESRLPILTVPGVFSIVGCAGRPTAVDDNEIAALHRVISHGLRREPWPALASGTKVTISRGPMQGVQGIVMNQKNSMRIIISVGILQRSVSVELDRNWLDVESGGSNIHC